MDKFDRVFQIHRVLSQRRTAISREDLCAKLDCTEKTIHRIVTWMRDELGAPIETVRNEGYRYRQAQDEPYALPGLWFSATELQALLTLQALLADRTGGLLNEYLAPLAKRFDQLIKHKRLNLSSAAVRIRLPAIASRSPGPHFQLVAGAVLQRKKLWFEYHARGTDRKSDRTVSPQRLTFYREAWYLDAKDESRNALRTFAIDRISHPRQLEENAVDIGEAELDEHFASSYGIFGGKADKIAVLVFTKERARWVADESWHPEQQSKWLGDGRFELRIPYSDARELVMDVLRHGSEVEVLGPAELRDEVIRCLENATAVYRGN